MLPEVTDLMYVMQELCLNRYCAPASAPGAVRNVAFSVNKAIYTLKGFLLRTSWLIQDTLCCVSVVDACSTRSGAM